MSTPALTWHLHSFDELSPTRLYALLKIRQEVFAVEQDSVYLDVDGKDSAALHLYALHGDVIQAYCRILAPDAKYAEASIGRVLTNTNNRRNGTGRALMQRAMQCCAERYPDAGVRISAQLHLRAFYESFGFVPTTPPYDEDGIAHIEMLKI